MQETVKIIYICLVRACIAKNSDKWRSGENWNPKYSGYFPDIKLTHIFGLKKYDQNFLFIAEFSFGNFAITAQCYWANT